MSRLNFSQSPDDWSLFNSLVRGERNIMCYSPLTIATTSSSSDSADQEQQVFQAPIPSFLIERPGDRDQSQRDAMVEFLRKNRGNAVRLRNVDRGLSFRHKGGHRAEASGSTESPRQSHEATSENGDRHNVVSSSRHLRLTKGPPVPSKLNGGAEYQTSQPSAERPASGDSAVLMSCTSLEVHFGEQKRRKDGLNYQRSLPVGNRSSSSVPRVRKRFPPLQVSASMVATGTAVGDGASRVRNKAKQEENLKTNPPKIFIPELYGSQSNVKKADAQSFTVEEEGNHSECAHGSIKSHRESSPVLSACTQQQRSVESPETFPSLLSDVDINKACISEPFRSISFRQKGPSSSEHVMEQHSHTHNMADLSAIFEGNIHGHSSSSRNIVDKKILNRTIINTSMYDMFARRPKKTGTRNSYTC